MKRRPQSTPDDFWARVTGHGSSTCWLWSGYVAKGVGVLHYQGQRRTAHEVALHICGVPRPTGYFPKWLCGNRLCVNPAHVSWAQRGRPKVVPDNTGAVYKVAERRGGATLSEAAKIFGVSCERVRQIEIRALAKLRHAMEREGLTFTQFVSALESGVFLEVFSEPLP